MESVSLQMPIIKSVGLNGQISLGKKYAGRQILLTECEDGTIILKPGRFIPDSEMWMYKNNGELRVDKGLDWLANNNPQDNYEAIINELDNA